MVLDKLIVRDRKMTARKRDSEILTELRKPQEDSEIAQQKEFPDLERLPGLKLTGQALADLLMVFEFLHNFGETLGFGKLMVSSCTLMSEIILFCSFLPLLDMDSLPSLQSLHLSLTCEDAAEAEEELLSVISHLLVCAIEDPGIPNPVRHTTLLGQSLRTADITNSNLSEILRIYLYAVATGEVRTQNGVTLDRERERRVADHHQLDPELMITTGKNKEYYEHLQQNQTWKLSECLKDKPFVALNPTVKAEILAHLCNDLLMNKAVVRQIENSLDAVAQHKRDRYAIENRIRKYKHMHARKLRLEQFEKQQQLAKQIAAQQQAMQAAAVAQAQQAAQQAAAAASATNENAENKSTENCSETSAVTVTAAGEEEKETDVATTENASEKTESTLVKTQSNLTNASSCDNLTDISELTNHKDDVLPTADAPATVAKDCEETSPVEMKPIAIEETKPVTPAPPAVQVKSEDFTNVIDASRVLNNGATTPDINNLLNKKIISKDATADGSTTDGNLDEELSDLESEGTILEDDEDNRMTSDELYKKLEKILKSASQNKILLEQSANSLRANCYGQDRYWRRYWHLPKAGGVFVEALESAQPEILKYLAKLEEDEQKRVESEAAAAAANAENVSAESGDRKRRGKKRKLTLVDEPLPEVETKTEEIEANIEVEGVQKKMDAEENVEAEVPIVTIIDEDEPMQTENVAPQPKNNDAATANGATSTANANDANDMLDIEDSIPRAILVQKASSNNDDGTVVEVNNQIGGTIIAPANEQQQQQQQPEQTDDSKALDESNCDSRLENGKDGIAATTSNSVAVEVKQETGDVSTTIATSAVINVETNAVACGDATIKIEIKNEFMDEFIEEPILEKWFSIANREIQLTSCETQIPLSSQAAYSNITCDMILQCQGNRWDIGNNAHYFHVPVEGPSNLQINRDSVLTLSGLDDEMMGKVLNGTAIEPSKPASTEADIDEDADDDEVKNGVSMDEMKFVEPETQPFQLPSFLNMSFVNINTFVQCDNPCPLQMTPDEQKMLDEVKLYGMPKRLVANFVPKELRHGWWKINELDVVNEIIQSLHVKGVRERELRVNLLQALTESIDLSTPCPIANLRSPPPLKGYIDPEPMNAWNPAIARRVELSLLDQVESLEDKIAGASMQIKGWTAPTRDTDAENELDLITGITMIRDRILGLEAAIERRYLKPPLGTSTAESNIAAITTQSVTLSSTREITTTITTTTTQSQQNSMNDDQNSSAGSVATTPEREVLPKGISQLPFLCFKACLLITRISFTGLSSWREAVARSHTAAQLAMALYVLESCVAWDKSIMKAVSTSCFAHSFSHIFNCHWHHSNTKHTKITQNII